MTLTEPSGSQPAAQPISARQTVYVTVSVPAQAQPGLLRLLRSELSTDPVPFLATRVKTALASAIGVFEYRAETPVPGGYELFVEMPQTGAAWPAGPAMIRFELRKDARVVEKVAGMIDLVPATERRLHSKLSDDPRFAHDSIEKVAAKLVMLFQNVPIPAHVSFNPQESRLSTNRTYDSIGLSVQHLPKAILRVHDDAAPERDALFVVPCGGPTLRGPIIRAEGEIPLICPPKSTPPAPAGSRWQEIRLVSLRGAL